MKFSEKNDLTRRSEVENGRNKSMTVTFYDFETRTRGTEDNLNASRREQQELQFSNSAISGTNRDLTAEIDALQLHCTTLTGQNRTLTNELQCFVQQDEEIRQALNRRDRVEQLRSRADTEI